MKILVVEDDAETLAYVSKGLQEAGHSVDASSDGLEGLELAETRDYEVAVLETPQRRTKNLSVVDR